MEAAARALRIAYSCWSRISSLLYRAFVLSSSERHRCESSDEMSAGDIPGQRRQTEGRSFLQKRRKAFGGCFLRVCFDGFFGLLPFGNMTEL
jgi:hypothetical protein